MNGWTDEEIIAVVRDHAKVGDAELGRLLGKSAGRVRYLRTLLGLNTVAVGSYGQTTRDKVYGPLTADEEAFITAHAHELTDGFIARYLNRPPTLIKRAVARLVPGIDRANRTVDFFDEAEQAFVRTHWLSMDDRGLMDALNAGPARVKHTSVKAVARLRSRLGLVRSNAAKVNGRQVLTEEALRFVVDNHGLAPLEDLAEFVGCTAGHLRIVLANMGLPGWNTRGARWTKERDALLVERADKVPLNELVRLLRMPAERVVTRMHLLGLLKHERGLNDLELTVLAGLRALKLDVHPQEVINTGGRRFTVDFLVHAQPADVVVQVHGDYWHRSRLLFPDGPPDAEGRAVVERDEVQRVALLDAGMRVLVIWEHALLNDLRGVAQELVDTFTADTGMSADAGMSAEAVAEAMRSAAQLRVRPELMRGDVDDC